MPEGPSTAPGTGEPPATGSAGTPGSAPGAGRTARRSLVAWLSACAAAAGVTLLAAGRTWATVRFPAHTGPIGAGTVPLSGTDLVASLTPAVLAALAAAAAVLAASGAARRLIGVVISLCGAVALAGAWNGTRPEAITGTAHEHVTTAMISTGGAAAAQSVAWAWPVAAMAGALVLVIAGVVAAVAGGRWPGMSSRYDRPARGSRTGMGPGRREGAPVTGERALWDALDEGDDPTAGPRP
ncbi:Trp biosynthesis-associated membrane protein [Microbispora sp. NPDC049125]|uniref:Trp biosynthesis-associated membrane protein n=1 Tax=Microbispora sp. NPDC049125 TaxID=3154929 RepID=UPI0034651CAD